MAEERNDLPTQPSLRRMQLFGIRPNRDLGQNFLIDSNILTVIGKAAKLDPNDVVLEVGGGLGVLSEYLASHTAYVHVVEIDERLREALNDALKPFENTALHMGDALKLDLGSLNPQPTKVVANLPYGVAATVILKTVQELTAVTNWVAMVQREVGERFAAGPGSGAYGVPSVLAQLYCDVKVLRPISRNVFYPVPNVDSVLVGLERFRKNELSPRVPQLVQAGFAHRRKALARSIALGYGDDKALRQQVREALGKMGHPEDARAETLAPAEWEELEGLLAEGEDSLRR
jgi:16S rRNA (adenine1518-N6/adenine1519-N6)-dimethyltransferase